MNEAAAAERARISFNRYIVECKFARKNGVIL